MKNMENSGFRVVAAVALFLTSVAVSQVSHAQTAVQVDPSVTISCDGNVGSGKDTQAVHFWTTVSNEQLVPVTSFDGLGQPKQDGRSCGVDAQNGKIRCQWHQAEYFFSFAYKKVAYHAEIDLGTAESDWVSYGGCKGLQIIADCDARTEYKDVIRFTGSAYIPSEGLQVPLQCIQYPKKSKE